MNYRSVLDFIDEAVLLLDDRQYIIYFNDAFKRIFPKASEGRFIGEFTVEVSGFSEFLAKGNGAQSITVDSMLFKAQIASIKINSRTKNNVSCILISDINKYGELVRESEEVNSELKKTAEISKLQNEKIMQQTTMTMQTAAIKESNILLQEMHDTLGHNLTVMLALNRLALSALPSLEKSREELTTALKYTGQSLAELELLNVMPEEGLVRFLLAFKDAMEQLGLYVTLIINGAEKPEHSSLFVPLTRICQECATNSLRHGNADKIFITLAFSDEMVMLETTDNGHFPEKLKKGNGLSGIELRVRNLSGTVEFGRSEDSGFRMRLFVPV